MNSINLVGNICNDLELKTTNSGKSVVSTNIAVQRPFTQDTTDFIPLIVWGNQAENLAKYMRKGSKIGVTGVLNTRKYQDKDGKTRTAFEVVANNIYFIESKKTEADPLKEVAKKVDVLVDTDDVDGDLPF